MCVISRSSQAMHVNLLRQRQHQVNFSQQEMDGEIFIHMCMQHISVFIPHALFMKFVDEGGVRDELTAMLNKCDLAV